MSKENKNKPGLGAIIGALMMGTIFTGFAFVFLGPGIGIVVLIISIILLYQSLTTSKKEIEEIRRKDAERRAERRAAERIHEQSLNIKCPTCQSSNVKRITTAKKAAYVIGLGILAPAFKKVRSQFECKKCGYKW